MRYIFIQTPLFDKKTPADCVTNFDKWMYNIINMPTMDIMAFVDEKLFDDFEKMAEYAAMCPVDRMAYDANEKAYRDLMGQIEYATMEGEARGEARGEMKGEARAKAQIVRNLSKQGVDLNFIATAVDLPVDKVVNILSSSAESSDK